MNFDANMSSDPNMPVSGYGSRLEMMVKAGIELFKRFAGAELERGVMVGYLENWRGVNWMHLVEALENRLRYLQADPAQRERFLSLIRELVTERKCLVSVRWRGEAVSLEEIVAVRKLVEGLGAESMEKCREQLRHAECYEFARCGSLLEAELALRKIAESGLVGEVRDL